MVVIALVGRKARLERSLVTVGKNATPLQQEIFTLISVFNNLPTRFSTFCSGQVHDFSGSVKVMLNSFSSLNLASLSSGQERMDRAGENAGLADLKENLRHLYEMVAKGIMKSRETTKEVKNLVDVVGYTSY